MEEIKFKKICIKKIIHKNLSKKKEIIRIGIIINKEIKRKNKQIKAGKNKRWLRKMDLS